MQVCVSVLIGTSKIGKQVTADSDTAITSLLICLTVTGRCALFIFTALFCVPFQV